MKPRELPRIDGKAVLPTEDHLEWCECDECQGWRLTIDHVPPDARFDDYE